MKLSSKIALSIWSGLFIAGFVVSIVSASNANLSIDVAPMVVSLIWLLGVITLALSLAMTLAWCGIDDEK